MWSDFSALLKVPCCRLALCTQTPIIFRDLYSCFTQTLPLVTPVPPAFYIHRVEKKTAEELAVFFTRGAAALHAWFSCIGERDELTLEQAASCLCDLYSMQSLTFDEGLSETQRSYFLLQAILHPKDAVGLEHFDVVVASKPKSDLFQEAKVTLGWDCWLDSEGLPGDLLYVPEQMKEYWVSAAKPREQTLEYWH